MLDRPLWNNISKPKIVRWMWHKQQKRDTCTERNGYICKNCTYYNLHRSFSNSSLLQESIFRIFHQGKVGNELCGDWIFQICGSSLLVFVHILSHDSSWILLLVKQLVPCYKLEENIWHYFSIMLIVMKLYDFIEQNSK